jgi:hypothetical protein
VVIPYRHSGNLSVSSSTVENKKKDFSGFSTVEDGADRLSGNIGNELPLYAA